jgi:hypothetical protein
MIGGTSSPDGAMTTRIELLRRQGAPPIELVEVQQEVDLYAPLVAGELREALREGSRVEGA